MAENNNMALEGIWNETIDLKKLMKTMNGKKKQKRIRRIKRIREKEED